MDVLDWTLRQICLRVLIVYSHIWPEEARDLLIRTVDSFVADVDLDTKSHRYVSERVKRILPHEIEWGETSSTIDVGLVRYTLLHRADRSRAVFQHRNPDTGVHIALDISYLYKLLRGVDEFNGLTPEECIRQCNSIDLFFRYSTPIDVVPEDLVLPKSGASDETYELFQSSGFDVYVGDEEELAEVSWWASLEDEQVKIRVYVG
jgi:hypothetical protein